MAATRKPRTSDDAPVETDEGTEPEAEARASEASTEDAPVAPEEPRPWRVETFSQADRWGYRVCAANGVIIKESAPDKDDAAAALTEAQEDSLTAGALFPSESERRSSAW